MAKGIIYMVKAKWWFFAEYRLYWSIACRMYYTSWFRFHIQRSFNWFTSVLNTHGTRLGSNRLTNWESLESIVRNANHQTMLRWPMEVRSRNNGVVGRHDSSDHYYDSIDLIFVASSAWSNWWYCRIQLLRERLLHLSLCLVLTFHAGESSRLEQSKMDLDRSNMHHSHPVLEYIDILYILDF